MDGALVQSQSRLLDTFFEFYIATEDRGRLMMLCDATSCTFLWGSTHVFVGVSADRSIERYVSLCRMFYRYVGPMCLYASRCTSSWARAGGSVCETSRVGEKVGSECARLPKRC